MDDNDNLPNNKCAGNEGNEKKIRRIFPCKFPFDAEKIFTKMFLIFLWFLILGFALTSRISAHIIIWNLGPLYKHIFENGTVHEVFGAADKNECSLVKHSVWALCIALVAPCIFTVYEARYMFDFALKESLKYWIVAMIVVLDLLDFGIKTVLVMIFLPAFDPYIAAIIFLFINPSVIGLLCICKEDKNLRCAHFIFGIFGLIAASCMAAVIWFEHNGTFYALLLAFLVLASLITFLWDYFANTEEKIINNSNDNGDITQSTSKLENSEESNDQEKHKTTSGSRDRKMQSKVSNETENKNSDATMSTLENNWNNQKTNRGCLTMNCFYSLFYLKNSDYYIAASGFASFVKIVIIIIIGVIFHFIDIKTTLAENCNNIFPYRVAGTNIGFSFMCYIFSKIACKILRQKLFFALPLTVSVIATPVVLYSLVHLDVPYFTEIANEAIPINLNEMELQFESDPELFGTLTASFVMGTCSFIYSIRHAYISGGRPPECSFRLFIKPMYNPFFIEQSLLLNRRRDDSENQEKVSEKDNKPKLYICATMWHEHSKEMLQLINSILRMDRAYSQTSHSNQSKSNDANSDLEVHIIFDDAFDEQGIKLNRYVEELLETLKLCLQQKQDEQEKGKSNEDVDNKPVAKKTPYGGRLTWILPEKNVLHVHLKDINKVKKRKRWSQVFYMQYIVKHLALANKYDLKNTFILALDGDVTFEVKSVRLLMERMQKK